MEVRVRVIWERVACECGRFRHGRVLGETFAAGVTYIATVRLITVFCTTSGMEL
jgi:hypothetical protein